MLTLAPIRQRDAFAYMVKHRHHKAPRGSILQVSVVDESGTVRGVAIVGRPVARLLDDGTTAEVTRVATDGAFNACSMLYGACWRAVRALGYRRLVTYTLPEEGGASLRASGWTEDGSAGGGKWTRDLPGRERTDERNTTTKTRWSKTTTTTTTTETTP